MSTGLKVLRFLSDAAREGQATALIAIVNVVGVASRSAGTLMAVTEDGRAEGSLSGGCVEAALAGEARRVISLGKAELLRLGAGSPLIDIRLPCGGGLDLMILPNPHPAIIAAAVDKLEHRRPATLLLSLTASIRLLDSTMASGWHDGGFAATLRPALKLLIIGHGEETLALTRLALAYGAEPELRSPAQDIVVAAQMMGIEAHFWSTRGINPPWRIDPATAVVFVLHDHDHEPALLAQLLPEKPFFIGAMGSRRTHTRRLSALRELGVGDADLERITSPIGLIPSTRDPETLALSVLAQVVEFYQQRVVRAPQVFEPSQNTRAIA